MNKKKMLEKRINELYDEFDLTFYNVPDVAKMLNVCERTILNNLRNGNLKGRKVGHKWVVSKQSINDFINGK